MYNRQGEADWGGTGRRPLKKGTKGAVSSVRRSLAMRRGAFKKKRVCEAFVVSFMLFHFEFLIIIFIKYGEF